MSGFRPTVRLRLTLMYGALFLVAGAVLLALNYGLVRRSLADRLQRVTVEVANGAPVPLFDQFIAAPAAGVQVYSPDPVGAARVIGRLEADFRAKTLDELVGQSTIALALMAVVSVGLGWIVAGRALRPLAKVTTAARQLSEDNLHERLALRGPADEIKELGDTFDAMLGRLESAFESQRRFAANASHELRTPLAIQRAAVDVALADPATSPEELRAMAVQVREAVDRSERLIDGLLALASSERGRAERAPCDLASAAAAALDQVADEARQRGLGVDARLDPAPLSGSRVLVERLVANLVQNAVRHNHDRGWLTVQTGFAEHTATIRVANSGPVVPPDQVETLFEPFRRAGPGRTGSQRGVGLGLSIVKTVAVSHGGTVRAIAPPQGGLDVTVALPRVR